MGYNEKQCTNIRYKTLQKCSGTVVWSDLSVASLWVSPERDKCACPRRLLCLPETPTPLLGQQCARLRSQTADPEGNPHTTHVLLTLNEHLHIEPLLCGCPTELLQTIHRETCFPEETGGVIGAVGPGVPGDGQPTLLSWLSSCSLQLTFRPWMFFSNTSPILW